MASELRSIGIVTPAGEGGNRSTSLRWATFLRKLGWHVWLENEWSGRPCELLIVLHARKGHDSVLRYREASRDAPLVVAAAGTDLYEDTCEHPAVHRSFELASRIVVLQPNAIDALPSDVRGKARVIHQSAVGPPDPRPRGRRDDEILHVLVLAHLREVKDPLRAALAARELRRDSRVRVTLLGKAIDDHFRAAARREVAENPRFRWLGALPRRQALRLMWESDLVCSSSVSEGGANVVTEALAAGVPVIATRIPGSTGLLGMDHPGLFPPRDTTALARMLERCENDPAFYAELERRSASLAGIADPRRECEAWRSLTEEML